MLLQRLRALDADYALLLHSVHVYSSLWSCMQGGRVLSSPATHVNLALSLI